MMKNLTPIFSKTFLLLLTILGFYAVSSQAQPFRGCPKGTEYVKPINASFEKEVLRLVNVERKKHGLQPLTWNEKMARAARYHAADMAHDDYFSHDSYDPGGKMTCETFDRIRKFGFGIAENIAAGSRTPVDVMQQWMTSEGHKRNILSTRSKSIGIGYYYKPRTNPGAKYFWVQNFSGETTNGGTGGGGNTGGGNSGGGNTGGSNSSDNKTKVAPKKISWGWKAYPFQKVDAATYYPGNRFYLFSGSQYSIWNQSTQRMSAPKPIRSNWRGVTFNKIDAAFYWQSNNKVYLFSGNQYVRYDVKSNKVDAGYPKPIQRLWGGSRMFTSVDAALAYPNGKVYFFKGNQYVRYDFAKNRIDAGYPKAISQSTWPGIRFRSVDATVTWGNGPKSYFFKNTYYYRFDIKKDKAY
ncbi:MAG TPA: hypothetical protein DCS93_36820 [Microscillaceae bacterium]|nr:hypothetical protein [Microscillaceae bacterium]